MQSGKGVNIRQFGAFCFEVDSKYVLPAQQIHYDLSKSIQVQRMERKHVHKIR